MLTMSKTHQVEAWRIATVWLTDWGQSPEMFHALYRWIDATGAHVNLRSFRIPVADFQREVEQPLKHWQPHGVVTRTTDWTDLHSLRRQFPGIPFVSTSYTPPGLADTCVVPDIAEALSLALDHFRTQGARSLALYYCGTRHAAERHLAAFRAEAPDGFKLVYPHEDQPRGEAKRVQEPGHRYDLVYPDEKGSMGAENVRQWLNSLPRPAGVVTLEVGAAGFLLEQCRRLGLRVPEDIQIIGADDVSVCLSFEPHLTSLALPRTRIGKVAMETMWHYLRGEQPPPPAVIAVAGSALVVRASTGRVHADTAAMNATLHLMKTQATRGISTARVAKLSNMGRSTLYRQFTAATGETPARHLRKMRIEEACRMLRETSDSITAIAKACGFSSLFAFSRSFRHETGLTPTAYREKMS